MMAAFEDGKGKDEDLTCGCGSEAVGWLVHSDWCPKYPTDSQDVKKKRSAMRFWSGVTKSWVNIDYQGNVIPSGETDDDAT